MKMFEDENGDEVENGDHDEDDDNDYDTYVFIVNPEGSMVQQYSTIHHLNTQVHDSDANLARHIARFDAITTRCGSH